MRDKIKLNLCFKGEFATRLTNWIGSLMCIPGLSDCVQLAEAISVLSFRKQLAALPRIGCISNTRQRLYFEHIWNNSSCFSRRLRLTANAAVLDFDLQQMVWKQPWYKVGFCTKCALLNTTVKLCLSGKQSAEIFLSSKPSEIGRISFPSSIFYNVFVHKSKDNRNSKWVISPSYLKTSCQGGSKCFA